jgi:hypothetical protein
MNSCGTWDLAVNRVGPRGDCEGRQVVARTGDDVDRVGRTSMICPRSTARRSSPAGATSKPGISIKCSSPMPKATHSDLPKESP